MLYKEYGKVAAMRLKFLASQNRRAEQFTVGKLDCFFVCKFYILYLRAEEFTKYG